MEEFKLNHEDRALKPEADFNKLTVSDLEHTMENGSQYSLNEIDHNDPFPSTLHEKKNATIKKFSFVLALMNAVFLFMLAIMVFIDDPQINGQDLTPIITLYIIVTGLIVLGTLFVDVTLYLRAVKKEEDDFETQCQEEEALNQEVDSGVTRDVSESERPRAPRRPPQRSAHRHRYCFVRGRHACSAYLKLGATAFAIGHLVHCALLFLIQISFANNSSSCHDGPQHAVDALYPLYSALELVLVFKYSDVIINRCKTTATIVFLHTIAGNLCLWGLAVTREINLALMSKNLTTGGSTVDNSTGCSIPDYAYQIFKNYSPYLYPFSVEYNILIAGCLYTIWSHIGACDHKIDEDFRHELGTQFNGSDSRSLAPDIRINCRGSSRGLFAGVLALIFLVLVIILGFVFGALDHSNLQNIGEHISNSGMLAFHLTMLVTVVLAYTKTRSLDVNPHPMPILDDVLLYICAPAFILDCLFTVKAAVNIINVALLLETIVAAIQMMIQTAFIVDGLRRSSDSRRLRRTRPGRELILFLLITNISMWIMYTFSYKAEESKDIRYLFYGKTMWTILGHVSTPLMMFYRFHSSACLAEMWSYAYKPSEGH